MARNLAPKPGPRIEADTRIETVRTSSNPLRSILEGLEPGQRYVDKFEDRQDAVRFAGHAGRRRSQSKAPGMRRSRSGLRVAVILRACAVCNDQP